MPIQSPSHMFKFQNLVVYAEPFWQLHTLRMRLLEYCTWIAQKRRHTFKYGWCLQTYYQMNRRMQLNNDLSAQASFVKQYQHYLAQLVGFFVIEERVGRVSDVLEGGQVLSTPPPPHPSAGCMAHGC